jgi:hypothetical protein
VQQRQAYGFKASALCTRDESNLALSGPIHHPTPDYSFQKRRIGLQHGKLVLYSMATMFVLLSFEAVR